MRSVEEKMEQVAAGRGISIIPLSVATFHQRPDVAAVPVNDLAANTVCIAWVASRRSHLIRTFAEPATSVDWTPYRPGGGTIEE